MNIALLSDIHGNLPALKAVFEEISNVDLIICCGDIVGYYPDVNEVCHLLRNKQICTIRGNHDAYITGNLLPEQSKSKIIKIEWTKSVLSPENYQWLNSLPIELQFTWDDHQLVVRHASPWDEESYLYLDSQQLQEIDLLAGEILALGHTHHSMLINAGEGIIINPGSVGQPRDWNPNASYAILDTRLASVDFKRVAYPIEEYQNRLLRIGWDKELISILGRIRK